MPLGDSLVSRAVEDRPGERPVPLLDTGRRGWQVGMECHSMGLL